MELETFGDRCPPGYTKERLLGKGGYAVVWLLKNQSTGEQVAGKQFPAKKMASLGKSIQMEEMTSMALKEYLKDHSHEGAQHISMLLDTVETRSDKWLFYQLGGQSLTDALFKIKGEFYKSERIYRIEQQDLYYHIKEEPRLMKQILTKLLKAIDLLSCCGIVHSDLKTDNILVEYNGEEITSLKLIDFGASFFFYDTVSLSLSTPEYLPPEILKYLYSREKMR